MNEGLTITMGSKTAADFKALKEATGASSLSEVMLDAISHYKSHVAGLAKPDDEDAPETKLLRDKLRQIKDAQADIAKADHEEESWHRSQKLLLKAERSRLEDELSSKGFEREAMKRDRLFMAQNALVVLAFLAILTLGALGGWAVAEALR